MDAKQTVKYVAFHQVLATLAAVVGLGIVGVGVWLGFGDAIGIVLNDAPQNWGDAVAAANPTTFAALAVVGVVVWQVGKTVALVVTVGKVAEAADTGGGADAAEVKRAVMTDVNDRLSSVESDVKRHEEAIAASGGAASDGDSSASAGESASAGGDGGGRRSRRRSSTTDEGSSDASADGDDAADAETGRESNRKSNRRASRSSDDRGSTGGDESAN